MTKEEIVQFAHIDTHTLNRTIITFKGGDTITGYFDNNTPNGDLHNQNKWNFVTIPQINNEKKQTTFDGDTFHSIHIIDIRQY